MDEGKLWVKEKSAKEGQVLLKVKVAPAQWALVFA